MASGNILDRARAVVDRLHALSDRQVPRMLLRGLLGIGAAIFRGDKRDFTQTERGKAVLADKLVALDRQGRVLLRALPWTQRAMRGGSRDIVWRFDHISRVGRSR